MHCAAAYAHFVRRNVEITAANEKWVIGAIYVAFAVPLVPLVLGWRGLVSQHARWQVGIALTILSLSYLWVLGVLAGASVIAPHYTSARTQVIEFNAGAALATMVVLGIVGRPMHWYHVVAGIGVFVLWAYLGVVGSVA
jgi:hypothetical protein